MSDAGTSLAGTLVGVLLALAALSLLVQVVQEVWKFLTSSRARCYSRVLVDFLGPWAEALLDSGVLLDLQARGPFQLRRLRPTGILLPLGRDELADGLERTAPYWHRRALEALRLEEAVQRRRPAPPSPAWGAFRRELAAVEPGAAGHWTAREVAEFLAGWEVGGAAGWRPTDPGPSEVDAGAGFPRGASGPSVGNVGAERGPEALDARALRIAFRRRFLPHVVSAEDHFPQLMKTFEYEYRRRNLRQTFTIALSLAVLADLPIQAIWRWAAAAGAAPDLALDGAALRALWEGGAGAVAAWVGGCLLTALVVCFGAPLWHDLTKLIASLARGGNGRPGGVGSAGGSAPSTGAGDGSTPAEEPVEETDAQAAASEPTGRVDAAGRGEGRDGG